MNATIRARGGLALCVIALSSALANDFDLSGLEELCQMIAGLAARAGNARHERVRGPAMRREFRELATAYLNAAAWHRAYLDQRKDPAA